MILVSKALAFALAAALTLVGVTALAAPAASIGGCVPHLYERTLTNPATGEPVRDPTTGEPVVYYDVEMIC